MSLDLGMLVQTMNFSTTGSLPAIGTVIPGKTEATHLAYHESGRRLYVSSSFDSRLQVIDCLDGKADQPALRCEREKIDVFEPTHHEELVLFAGKGSPTQPVGQRNAVHYWSLYDNKILRKFRGHSDQVSSIAMCPSDDSFLTSSLDRTVRLWTANQAGCLAELKLPDETIRSPLASFDCSGLVFGVTAAIASESKGYYLHLYDARNYSAGAFAELKILQSDLETAIQSHVNVLPDRAAELSGAQWTSFKFNYSGDKILIGTDRGMSVLLDGFTGAILRVILGSNSRDRKSVCCVTPDDETVLLGNDDGSITCWSVHEGVILNTLKGHIGPVNCIAANPKYAQFASACSQTALWIWENH